MFMVWALRFGSELSVDYVDGAEGSYLRLIDFCMQGGAGFAAAG